MKAPVIILANDTHHDNPVVRLRFAKNYNLHTKVKATRGAAWSQSQGFCLETKECFNIAFANHHLEHRMDLLLIQESLGHKSSKTTEIYTHVTDKSLQKIKSPFDDL
jgi:site-specific recombinase XerC